MSVHGPGRTVEGTDPRPRWFFCALLGGGGGGGGAVSEGRGGCPVEGELPSTAKTQRASTLGNHRRGRLRGGVGVPKGHEAGFNQPPPNSWGCSSGDLTRALPLTKRIR